MLPLQRFNRIDAPFKEQIRKRTDHFSCRVHLNDGLFHDIDSIDDVPDEYFDCEIDDMYAYRIDRENKTDEEPVLCICLSENYSE